MVTGDTSTVTLAIIHVPSNGGTTKGTLSCTGGLTKAAVAGVATFSGCQVGGTAGAGTYTLAATDGSLTATGACSTWSSRRLEHLSSSPPSPVEGHRTAPGPPSRR